MNINKNDTAIVVIDPQNDVLSEKGVSWDLVGDSVKENKTVENIERIFKAAKRTVLRYLSPPTITTPPTMTGTLLALWSR